MVKYETNITDADHIFEQNSEYNLLKLLSYSTLSSNADELVRSCQIATKLAQMMKMRMTRERRTAKVVASNNGWRVVVSRIGHANGLS